MNIETIQKEIKRYASFMTLASISSRPRVYLHWEIILMVFVVFNIFMLFFSGYLFLQVNSGTIFLVEQSGQVRVESVDRSEMQEVLTSLEGRSALFEQRKSAGVRIADPSQ
ncbi:MAG: hypothetical protein OQJ98_02490 [Candidatus Pacebacteria bacterium]|nr:hypothetical protein [Candidatus Paceibacterota bacterium]